MAAQPDAALGARPSLLHSEKKDTVDRKLVDERVDLYITCWCGNEFRSTLLLIAPPRVFAQEIEGG